LGWIEIETQTMIEEAIHILKLKIEKYVLLAIFSLVFWTLNKVLPLNPIAS